MNWARLPQAEGEYSRQAHADLPAGSYEREMGKDGFAGPATHFCHAHPPTGWLDFDGPLQPHALDLLQLDARAHSPWQAALLLSNAHCQVRWWELDAAMPHLARNGDGDELFFVHAGQGQLFCDWGQLALQAGDYLLLPRGSLWRLEPEQPLQLLLIEATAASYQLPDRGLLGQHAQFDPAVLQRPTLTAAFRAQQGAVETVVEVKRRGQLTRIRYPYNPLDAIGWHGDLYPLRLNWRDIRPLTSHRYHLPPTVHATWVSREFLISTFVPRPIESDPGALKVPFFHSNDDYDEAIFYHQGQFFSRDNIHPGMLTLHPAGFPHGPHPKAFAAGEQHTRQETDEVALMIDSRAAFDLSPISAGCSAPDYAASWRSPGAHGGEEAI